MKSLSKFIILIILSMFQYTLPISQKERDWLKNEFTKILTGAAKNEPKESAWDSFSPKDKVSKAGTQALTEGVSKGIEKTKACADVVALGTEWAAKQAGLQTAKGVLKAAETLQKTDPRLVGLLIAQKTASAALDAAQGTLFVAQKASEVIAKATKLAGDIVSKGFSVDSITFNTTSKELMAQKPLTLRITGTIAGQHFNTTVKDINFSNVDSFVTSILKNLNPF